MFIGRENELEQLEQCYKNNAFEMVVLYGRRRVGKTFLLQEFSKNKKVLFYAAQKQSDKDNLSDFSRVIHSFFELPSYIGSFATWDDAFLLIAEKAGNEHFAFVFDEFPYAAESCESLPSKLQIAIDHHLKKTSLCLVLCGSDQGFMESEVLGEKSPLHGRRTAQIHLSSFNYLDTAKLLSWAKPEDVFKYYACIGGTPYYLSQVDAKQSFTQNVANLFFDPMGFLYEEPVMLLQQELREPALYNSVMRAIASGANRQNEIVSKTGIPTSSIQKYLRTLIRLELIERIVPFGENPQTCKQGLYRLSEACYAFWYRFVAPYTSSIELGLGKVVASHISPDILQDYLARRFERVCGEWLLLQAKESRLPFSAICFGSWWGTDHKRREQADIDVVAANKATSQILLGECKWRNSFNETAALQTLEERATLIKGYKEHWFFLFSKNPVSKKSGEKFASRKNVATLCLNDLYDIEWS